MWHSLYEGLLYAAHHSTIRALLLLSALLSLLGIWYISFMPIFARDVFHGGALVYGQMVAAVACGALAGAFLLARQHQINGLGVHISLASFGLGFGWILFPLIPYYPLALVCLALLGFSMVTFNVGINTVIQTLAPDGMRSRIVSVYTMSFLGIGTIGTLGAGWIAEWIGVTWTLMLAGTACLFVALLFCRSIWSISEEVPYST